MAGNGTAFSGDGGPPLRAELDNPTGVTVDGAGDIAFTAVPDPDNVVDTTVDLIAARSGTFFGRRLTAGTLYTLAGNGIAGFRGDNGPARDAQFRIGLGPRPWRSTAAATSWWPTQANDRVRLIAVRSGRFYGRAMTAGDIYTIAGTGGFDGFSGDGGPAVKAKLDYPTAAGVDHHGNVLIADAAEPPGAGRRRRHRHLLRPEDDRRRHLHRRGRRRRRRSAATAARRSRPACSRWRWRPTRPGT